jgi:hypothetical protein
VGLAVVALKSRDWQAILRIHEACFYGIAMAYFIYEARINTALCGVKMVSLMVFEHPE